MGGARDHLRGSCGQPPLERGRTSRWLRGDRTAEAERRESKLYIRRWSHFNKGPHVRPQTAGGCSQAKPALDEEKAPCVPRACVRSSGESAGCGDGDPGLRRLPPRWHVLCAQSNALLPWVLPFPSLLSPRPYDVPQYRQSTPVRGTALRSAVAPHSASRVPPSSTVLSQR